MTGASTFGSQPMNIINPYVNGAQTLVPLTSLTHQQIMPATEHVYVSNPSQGVPVMTSQFPSGLMQNTGMGQHVSLVQPQSAVSTLIRVPATIVQSKFQFTFEAFYLLICVFPLQF